MALTFEEFLEVLKSLLTKEEGEAAVIYAAQKPVAPGASLAFPGITIKTEKQAWLAFADRDPMANWGHPARYIIVYGKDDTRSYESRLPPFKQDGDIKWCVVYKAPPVPENIIKGFPIGPSTITF